MNRFYFFLFVLFTFFASQAQDYPLDKGAKISFENNVVSIKSDEVLSVPFEILRSKHERRTKFATPTLQNLNGLTYDVFTTESKDQFVLKLDASEVPDGNYTLIVKGSGQFKRYLTSTMVTLKVEKERALIVNND